MGLFALPLLAFVFFNDLLPSWGSRKVLHMGTGTLLIHTDPTDPLFSIAVYLVTIGFVVVTCFHKLHFADYGDVGIINYLLFCSVCVTCRVPFHTVMPLFFADPMGAIVGRTVASPKLVGSKSIAGTAAVFATTFVTASENSLEGRLLTSFMIATIELFAGKWDNPAIGAYLLFRYSQS